MCRGIKESCQLLLSALYIYHLLPANLSWQALCPTLP